MTVLPVTYKIYDNILMITLPKLQGEINCIFARLNMICIDVYNGSTKSLGDLSGVFIGPSIFGRGGIADLVIDDNMYGACDLVFFKRIE